MIPQRQLYGRVVIGPPSPEEKRLQYRRARYTRRMLLAGIRPESIRRYIARGFKGPFVRALLSEMQRLTWDIKYRRRG
jgi:hypothetical protein